MMSYRWTFALLTVALVASAPRSVAAGESNLSVPRGADETAEPMLRGPLHEAFAEPIQLDPQAGTVVPKKPPEPIEEVPPEAKPADENVVWIPGYWAWDEEREDFIYVSGVWRVPPEGQRWVPGYWTQSDAGYQWVAGFWAPVQAEEVQYLPYPPESLESGPNSPAPSDGHYWVSGCWHYRDSRYAWRPGYWDMLREDRVCVPAHYVWTPQGVVFVDRYWDYPFAGRGVVFAPVCFSRPFYARPGFCYTPNVVINCSHLLMHLFVQPRSCRYYWGDYYGHHSRPGHRYDTWFDHHGRHGYDPMFAYYSAYHRRRNIDYVQRLRGWHDYFQRHEDCRPAHSMSAQVQLATRAARETDLQYSLLGNRMDEVLSRKDEHFHFDRVSADHRQAWAQVANQTRELTRRRLEIETARKPAEIETRSKPQTRLDGLARFGVKADVPKPTVKLKLPELARSVGSKSAVDPGHFGHPRSGERIEVPKIDGARNLADKIKSDHDALRGRPKPWEGSPPNALHQSLPDVSKLRRPDVASHRDAKPKIEIPQTPAASPANVAPALDVKPKTEIPRSPRFSKPKMTLSQNAKTMVEIPGRPGFSKPHVTSSHDLAPKIEVTKPQEPAVTGPPADVLRAPSRGRSLGLKLPDQLPGQRSDSSPAAKFEVRRPEFKAPPVISPRVPGTGATTPRSSPLSSVARPKFEIPQSLVTKLERHRSEAQSRSVPRPEVKLPDVPKPRFEAPLADSKRDDAGRGPGNGRNKR